jgi:L-amino acid N-acyltransferase YncA
MIQIRPATPNDLSQVHQIATHYVQNSCLTFLQNPVSQSMVNAKFGDITESRGLPYLVAVEKTEKYQQGVVVGYTYLSPFRGYMLSYGPTVELTIFVHPDHQSRAIGTQLLTTVLEKARDPGVLHRAREIVVDDEGVEKIMSAEGEGVRLRNILAVMAVDTDGKDKGEALRKWYIKRGFVERGRMEKFGFKMGRW